MFSNKKVEEGEEHIKNAEKSLKTSLLKWRPDYDNAADEYNKAATCFRNAKSYEKCKDCLLKAVECHKQNRAIFYAAKALDQCVLVCKELGDFREVSSLAERAATMFQTHGSNESAVASLDKAAKILESQQPDDALKLYKRAAEIVSIQDSTRQTAEYTNKMARLHVKLRQFDQAAQNIRRELGHHIQNESYQAAGRLTVALVLVQLARNDLVAAEKSFKEFGSYCEVPEVQTVEAILQAYDEEDPDGAKQALNSPFIKHMDVEYAILARDIPLPKGICIPTKGDSEEQNVDKNSQDLSSKEPPKEEFAEDDEYAGGLC